MARNGCCQVTQHPWIGWSLSFWEWRAPLTYKECCICSSNCNDNTVSVLHSQWLSLTDQSSIMCDDSKMPDLIDKTNIRTILLVSTWSAVVVLLIGLRKCHQLRSFLRLWENFYYIKLCRYIYIYFSFFPGLPLADFLQCLATPKENGAKNGAQVGFNTS